MTNYWTKDQTRQEIITKMQIPNKANMRLFANYYNLMDTKGLGLQLSKDPDLPNERLFRKNDFEYIVLNLSGQRELFILPNDKIVDYTTKITMKIDICKSEKEVLKLILSEMN